MLRRELVDEPNDLVLHEAEPLGAAASAAILDEQALGLGTTFEQGCLEPPRDRQTQFVTGMRRGKRLDRTGDRGGVELLRARSLCLASAWWHAIPKDGDHVIYLSHQAGDRGRSRPTPRSVTSSRRFTCAASRQSTIGWGRV